MYIELNKEGVYLFTAPVHVSSHINRELVIVFALPTLKTCGIIFCEKNSNPKKIVEWLDTLYEKVKRLEVTNSHVFVKLFGMSAFQKNILQEVHTWIRSKQLMIASEDLGRNVSRHISLRSETGTVGVTYLPERQIAPEIFFAAGTARNRATAAPAEMKAIIVSPSLLKGTLAKQAVEEHPRWSALLVTEIDHWLSRKDFKNVANSVVLLFEEIGSNNPVLATFLENTKTLRDRLRLCWIGKQTRESDEMHWLGPLEPERIGLFKTELAKVLSPLNAQIGESQVLPFRKSKQSAG